MAKLLVTEKAKTPRIETKKTKRNEHTAFFLQKTESNSTHFLATPHYPPPHLPTPPPPLPHHHTVTHRLHPLTHRHPLIHVHSNNNIYIMPGPLALPVSLLDVTSPWNLSLSLPCLCRPLPNGLPSMQHIIPESARTQQTRV